MKIDFLEDYHFFTGVPDSQLKPLCNYLLQRYGISENHIIAANEGNCVAIAAGHYLATGEVPVVYLQNSGIGNIINPVASLLNQKVYGIPCLFIVGWRGEPGGAHDEPQHIYQGEVTMRLLQDIGMEVFVLGKSTKQAELQQFLKKGKQAFANGKQIAILVQKDALEYECDIRYANENCMVREEILRHIVDAAEEDVIVSTTGKTSRELFEIREQRKEGHAKDFLTVGSMGHASSIAFGIALAKPEKRIWCIDGDGAFLMHMGAPAVIGSGLVKNMIHVVINNEAHESVGGMPTVAKNIDLAGIAKDCGYHEVFTVSRIEELEEVLKKAKRAEDTVFIEAKSAIGSRANLGRPTTTTQENKAGFMSFLKG